MEGPIVAPFDIFFPFLLLGLVFNSSFFFSSSFFTGFSLQFFFFFSLGSVSLGTGKKKAASSDSFEAHKQCEKY